MDEKYIFLKGYTEWLIEKGTYYSDIGLWNGKMGIAIYLLHISRITQDERYENKAFEMIDAVYEQISSEKSLCFDDGLLGVGCGFEYIITNGFVDADRDEVLSEIDIMVKDIIDCRSIDNISLEKGVCGIGYYLYYRLENRLDDKSMVVLILKEYLIYLIDWVEDLLLKTISKQDYNDVYFLLVRLHRLNVFNHKVEKLLACCLLRMIELNCSLMDDYEFLGVDLLKILKTWI